jgi:hypothetical protein
VWSILSKEWQIKILLRFLDEVLEFKGDNPPKIIVNSLLISELFNACFNREFHQYREMFGEISKKDFRMTESYEVFVENINADLESYEDSIEYINNEEINPMKVLQDMPLQVNYCDYYYYELSLEENLTIVTDDHDFLLPSVPILTASRSLLRNSS